jgi:agmatine deiminase
MRQYHFIPLVMATTLVVAACGKPAADRSSLEGHYEEATADDMAEYTGMQDVVPEYKPTSGVIVSLPLITEFNREDLIVELFEAGADKVWLTTERTSRMSKDSSVFNRLAKQLGDRFADVELVPQAAGGNVTVWARDWAPLGAASRSEAFADDLRLVDFNYYPRRQADDAAARAMETVYSLERISVPVYNEGGNFMNNDRGDCMMSTRVVEANAARYFSNDMVLNREQIKTYYRDFAGCRRVTIFDRLPYEGTGHIDMWAKFLDNETVLVGSIYDESLEYLNRGSQDYQAAMEIREYLDARAADIRALGYNVLRIPMPTPIISRYSTLRSYTNSLLVNGTAIVPQYNRAAYGYRYADQQLKDFYEAEVRDVYEQAGYEVRFVPSDQLIFNGGAVHCVTMQVPRL